MKGVLLVHFAMGETLELILGTIILICLIGYFNDTKIQNIFIYEELPKEFLKILNEDNILFK